MTFDQIVAAIESRLNLTSPTATTRIQDSVNRVYRRVTSSLGINLTRRTNPQVTGTATLGSPYITFNLDKIETLIDKSSGSDRILKERTVEEMRACGATHADPATEYAIFQQGANTVTILTNCTAQTNYVLYADGYTTLVNLTTGQTPGFPEDFHDILIEGVLFDEYRKLEKTNLASMSKTAYEQGLSDLRLFLAKSPWLLLAPRSTRHNGIWSSGGGSGGGGSLPNGAASYTQTGLITFDRTGNPPGSRAPFAVAAGSEAVANFPVADTGIVFTDNTTGNVSTSAHGYMIKAPNDITKFFRGDATYAVPPTVTGSAAGYAPASPTDATKYLNGANPPAYASVKDSDLSTTDITTNNVSTSKHGFTPKAPADTSQFLRGDASWATAFPQVSQGRLTLTSGVPVTVSDVTGAATVYFTPYGGNRIALFTGGAWKLFTFTEIAKALGTLVNAQAYDIFAFDNSGTPSTELNEWANATITVTIAAPGVVTWTGHGMSTGQSITFTTTGALPTGITANTQYFITVVDANTFKLSTSLANVAAGTFITTTGSQSGTHTGHQPQARTAALQLQDGVLVKNGDATRKYLGTFLMTATTTTEDSFANRYLWNYYNRVRRVMRATEATATWAYTTAAYRQANANAANQLGCVVGVAEIPVDVRVVSTATNSAGGITVVIAIGEDATSAAVTGGLIAVSENSAGLDMQLRADLVKYPTIGRHAYIWLEQSGALGTTTWRGTSASTQSGITGTIDG